MNGWPRTVGGKMLRRALFTLCWIVMAAALISMLAGCAALDEAYDRAHWEWDGMETATYTWIEAPGARDKCGNFSRNTINWGCAIRMIHPTPQHGAKPVPGAKVKTGHCIIFSSASEEDAKRIITTDGDDLWSHELRHCNGWNHPQRKP